MEDRITKLEPIIKNPSLWVDKLVYFQKYCLLVDDLDQDELSVGLLMYLWGVGKGSDSAPYVQIREAALMYLELWTTSGDSVAVPTCIILILGVTRMGNTFTSLPYLVARKLNHEYDIEESALQNTDIQERAKKLLEKQKSIFHSTHSTQGPNFNEILSEICQLKNHCFPSQ